MKLILLQSKYVQGMLPYLNLVFHNNTLVGRYDRLDHLRGSNNLLDKRKFLRIFL